MNNHKIKFSKPASIWEETILLGNGHTGVSLWGGIGKERIHLNHDSFWAGTKEDNHRKGDSQKFQKLRSLLLNGNYKEAEAYAESEFYGLYTSPYLSMGELIFDYETSSHNIEKYERSLDLSEALYTSSLETDNGVFSTRGFDSYPDEVCVLSFSTEGKTSYNGFLEFIPPSTCKSEVKVEANGGAYSIEANLTAPSLYDGFINMNPPVFNDKESISGYVRVEIFPVDGSVSVDCNKIQLNSVSRFTIIIALNTNFEALNGKSVPDDISKKCREDIQKASVCDYVVLFNRHRDDYSALYNDTTLSLSNGMSSIAEYTPDRIRAYAETETDIGLIESLFNYGRYLLISSSRLNSQPSNLQGVWNSFDAPPWWANYTLNINTEMNYWGACKTGLSSCSEALFDFALRLKRSGERTARELYSCDKGWCVHHQTDIWANTGIRGGTSDGPTKGHLEYSLWPYGGIWLSLMAWEHYEYTGDEEFLKAKAKPLLQGSIAFLRQYLIKGENGELTTCPSTSPENRFLFNGDRLALSIGSTMDLSLSSEAIGAFIEMGKVIDVDMELLNWSLCNHESIHPYKIGKLGHLQEWSNDWDRPEDKHRHVSHLFSIFPGDSLMRREDKHYRAGAEKSLEMRGLSATGWSSVWKICLYARLGKPEMIRELFRNFLTLITEGYGNGGQDSIQYAGSGVYPNLLCAHPPFNIDGNLGMVGAIVECIVQYYHESLYVLPAIPENWKNGKLTGVHLKHGLRADIAWENNKLSSLLLYSTVDMEISLVYNKIEEKIQLKKNETFCFNSLINYSAVL